MIPVKIEQLAHIIDGRLFSGSGNGLVCGVSIDSRTIETGEVFFAIRGRRFDGHDFARSAAQKGAVCLILEHPVELLDNPSAVVVVDDTVAALGKLAGWYRLQLNARVIAITGSAGKTTTRQMLHEVLSTSYRCRQAPKSFNNLIGVSLTILSGRRDDDILLLELGSNRSGEIAVLSELAKPDAAVVTFIGPAHLEGFGTLANVLREKVSIVNGLRQGGTLYVNGDQPELLAGARKRYDGRIITFGTTENCDIIGTDLQTAGHVGRLVIGGQSVVVPLAGRASLMNALTVWSVCRDLKIPLSDFIDVIGRLKPFCMRLEVIRTGALTILNDCYNANPASMANALECLKSFKAEGKRRVFIAGTMNELGEQSTALHTELGRSAAKAGVKLLLCVGRFAENTAAGALRQNAAIQVQTFENTERLCNNLHKTIRPDDIVLVKASRAAGLEKAVQRLCELFGV